MRASRVSAPTLAARISSAPEPFTVPPMTLAPGCFDTGIPSPVTIDSSTLPLPDRTDPVHRQFFPGSYPEPVADGDLVERHLLLGPVVAKTVCGRRG